MSRRLTVVQLLPALEGGGVERGVLEVAGELVRRGHRSIVVSAGGRLVEELTAGGSEHLCLPIGKKSPTTLWTAAALRQLCLRERVDILHARSRVPAWAGYLAWKSLRAAKRPRWVTTVHGMYSVGRYSAIMCSGERVIAVSETIREYIFKNYPRTPRERVELIYRGVDPAVFVYGQQPSERWRAQWQADFPQTVGRRLLTLPGRLTRLKGHHALLDLMKQLAARRNDVHALVVGGEDPRRAGYAEEIRRRIAQLGLTDQVTMTGHRADVKEIFAASDVVLSLSTQPESFGRTVLEALRLGVPVAGYAHGGVGEILQSLFPAGAVPLDDAAALQQCVERLLDERPIVPPSQKFQLSEMLARTVDLYESVTEGTIVRAA